MGPDTTDVCDGTDGGAVRGEREPEERETKIIICPRKDRPPPCDTHVCDWVL